MEKFRKTSENNLPTFSFEERAETEKVKKRKSESSLPEPMFRIGGKTDPERFSTTENRFFFRIGFHDDERSDTASPQPGNNRDFYFPDRSAFFDTQRRILMERMVVSATTDLLKLPRPIIMTSSSPASVSSLRTTLSPVREVVTFSPSTPTTLSSVKQCSLDCSKSAILRVRLIKL